MAPISENLAKLRRRIRAQALGCGRRPEDILLVAVGKAQPAAAILQACQAGQRHFGESYAQEGVAKLRQIARPDLVWHFIGAPQSNKAALLARHFDWVHAVARPKIARRLAAHRAGLPPLNVLLQVNIDRDPAKAGAVPEAVPELLDLVRGLEGLRLRGLMTVLEKGGAPDLSFAHMRRLFASLSQRGGKDWDTLSMGMTQDMDAAIAQGATQLRIGTAIFGPRQRPGPQPGGQSGAQPGPQPGSQPGLQSGAQFGLQSGAQFGPQSGPQPGTEALA